MEIIVYILIAVTSIQSIGGLYIIYRLALLVKAKDLYEAKAFSETTNSEENQYMEEDLTEGPLTRNLFANVTPSK